MIKKLYKLKEMQIQQKLIQKVDFEERKEKINMQILLLQNQIQGNYTNKQGLISDFSLLQIHKNTIRYNLKKLEKEKKILEDNLQIIARKLVELQKNAQQFKYILEEEKKQGLKKILLDESEASFEFIQSRYISIKE